MICCYDDRGVSQLLVSKLIVISESDTFIHVFNISQTASYLQLAIMFVRKQEFHSLQEFVKAKKNQKERQAQCTTRGTIEYHFGDLIFKLFLYLFREERSFVRSNCRRIGLLPDFLGDYRPLLRVRPVLPLPDESRKYFINHDVIRGIDLDERRHGYLEQFILVGVGHLNGSPFPAETDLAVAAFDPWTLVQADVNGAAELDVGAFRKLEGPEFRRQEVAIHGVEIFEQVRIDGAPVNNNRFLLRLGIGDQHVSHQQAVDRRRIVVQKYFHLQRRAGTDVELAGHQDSTLPHSDAENRHWCRFLNLLTYVDHFRFLKARRKNAPPYRRVIGRDGDFWLHDNFGDYAFHRERVLAGIRWLLHYYPMIVHLLTRDFVEDPCDAAP